MKGNVGVRRDNGSSSGIVKQKEKNFHDIQNKVWDSKTKGEQQERGSSYKEIKNLAQYPDRLGRLEARVNLLYYGNTEG